MQWREVYWSPPDPLPSTGTALLIAVLCVIKCPCQWTPRSSFWKRGQWERDSRGGKSVRMETTVQLPWLLYYCLNPQFGHWFSAQPPTPLPSKGWIWHGLTPPLPPANLYLSKWSIWNTLVLIKMQIPGLHLRPIESELGENRTWESAF